MGWGCLLDSFVVHGMQVESSLWHWGRTCVGFTCLETEIYENMGTTQRRARLDSDGAAEGAVSGLTRVVF